MNFVERGNKQIVEGVIWKQLLIFFFPIMLGTFFQQLYNTVDAVVVGRYVGKVALAAVGGPTSTVIALLVGFFAGLSTGATVVIAQFYGADDPERTSRAVHTAMALALAAGAAMTVLGVALAEWTLAKMQTPPDVMPHAVSYLRIYFAGIVPSLLYNMGSGILRAKGDSKRPFYLLAGGTVVNLAADLLLIVRYDCGVDGVAYATILSQGFCAAGVWWLLARESGPFRLELRKLRCDWLLLQNIIRIGLPTGIQATMYSFSNIIIQAVTNKFGVDVVAAWATLGKIDALYWMVMSAFGMALSTFSGQNFGAQRYDRVIRSIRVCSLMAFVATGIIVAAFLSGGEFWFRIFTDDAQVIGQGLVLMRLMVPWYFSYVPVETISGGIRGTGDSLLPTLIMAVGVCAFRLAWMWLVVPSHWDIRVVAWSYPISWAQTAVLFVLYYLFSGWMKRSIARAGHLHAAA